jgi:hypothetical protein
MLGQPVDVIIAGKTGKTDSLRVHGSSAQCFKWLPGQWLV